MSVTFTEIVVVVVFCKCPPKWLIDLVVEVNIGEVFLVAQGIGTN